MPTSDTVLTAREEKFLHAAGRAARETGAVIASHTTSGILRRKGCAMSPAMRAPRQVSLQSFDRSLQLEVTDLGIGFDPGKQDRRPSLGLANMWDRARLLGGEVDIESAPGRGTTILA